MMRIPTPTLLERFCRYVRIDTEAKEDAGRYPSSPGQFELGKLLVEELKEIGLADVEQSEFGIVTATIPSTVRKDVPVVAFIAHLDTSPETSGKNVKPVVHENYDGRDLVLPGDPTKVLRPSEEPDLLKCVGKTVITTDGTTLLGSDNKSGVAAIVEAAKYLIERPEIPHGEVRVCFTCDEEIGHGTDHVDLKQLGAVVGYTLDGAGEGEIEAETFSADKATVTITGVNIHPSIGKGRMVNAIKLAARFLNELPGDALSPETTDGRDGFVHPYVVEGGVGEVKLHFILRDFVTDKLRDEERLLREIARKIMAAEPRAKIEIEVKEQYRNMADGMKGEPRAVEYAVEAMKRIGLKPHLGSIRGGTDGSLLTAKGLPTPNLSTAEHHFHSPLEWTCLEEMQTAATVVVELAKRWAE